MRAKTKHTLLELRAEFIAFQSRHGMKIVKTLDEAQGLIFLCPACFEKNGGARGTHSVICWTRKVPEDLGLNAQRHRYRFEGAGLEDLSLKYDIEDQEPEDKKLNVIDMRPVCYWQGFVKKGFAK